MEGRNSYGCRGEARREPAEVNRNDLYAFYLVLEAFSTMASKVPTRSMLSASSHVVEIRSTRARKRDYWKAGDMGISPCVPKS